jgi:predicted RNase H-like nuclease
MTSGDPAVTIAGVDGCKAGWIAVIQRPGEAPGVSVFGSFSDLVTSLPDNTTIAVDMPIGLPEFSAKGGRGPEAAVRAFLGARQSSVFSIPSRAALYADTEPFVTVERWHEAHRKASAVARITSDPPRGVSIQAFGLFSKIREIDSLLRARPELRPRIRESHPEVAFCRLNGGQAMSLPKKIKGTINPAGMEERKALLCARFYSRSFLGRTPPKGAGADDFLDAAAMMLIARRIVHGEARPYPDPPGLDGHGIAVAIWA